MIFPVVGYLSKPAGAPYFPDNKNRGDDMRVGRILIAALAACLGGGAAIAEEWRSLDDVKKMVLERAGKRGSFAEVKRGDVEQILNNIKTLDRDEWAREWCRTGLKYEAEGDALVKSKAGRHEIAETYNLAFNY